MSAGPGGEGRGPRGHGLGPEPLVVGLGAGARIGPGGPGRFGDYGTVTTTEP